MGGGTLRHLGHSSAAALLHLQWSRNAPYWKESGRELDMGVPPLWWGNEGQFRRDAALPRRVSAAGAGPKKDIFQETLEVFLIDLSSEAVLHPVVPA